MEYEIYEKTIEALKSTRQYIQQAHDDAQAAHDNYGDSYMDSCMYEIMEETEKLLLEIDELCGQAGLL